MARLGKVVFLGKEGMEYRISSAELFMVLEALPYGLGTLAIHEQIWRDLYYALVQEKEESAELLVVTQGSPARESIELLIDRLREAKVGTGVPEKIKELEMILPDKQVECMYLEECQYKEFRPKVVNSRITKQVFQKRRIYKPQHK